MTEGQLDLLADRDAWSAASCSVGRALEVVGTRSSMLLLREAFYGTRRFDDFAGRVGITEAVAAARLRALVEAGLFSKVPYQEPGQRARMEYLLTPMGLELYPTLVALMQWGDAHLSGESGPPVSLLHRGCGSPIRAEVLCAAGHQVASRDVLVTPGPRRRKLSRAKVRAGE